MKRYKTREPRTTEQQYLDDIAFFTQRNAPYMVPFHDDGDVHKAWYEINDVVQDIPEYIEIRQTNLDKKIHIIELNLESNAEDISLRLFKDPDSFTAGSVPLGNSSYNHLEDPIPTLENYQDPTNITLGGAQEKYFSRSFGVEQGGNKTSFSKSIRDVFTEIILDPTGDYLVEINNNGLNNVNLIFTMSWYETDY